MSDLFFLNQLPTPHLYVGLNLKNCRKAIDFYKAAFSAEELMMMEIPETDLVGHAVLKIGHSVISVCDESPDWNALTPETTGGCPMSLNIQVDDCDSLHTQALSAGATEEKAPADYPWGERASALVDPFGYRWMIAQHIEDVSPEEIQERLKTWQP